MTATRQVLDLLSRDELHELVDRHDITVADRRAKAHLADGIVASGMGIPDLLAGLSRDRLKELCRALGLDDGGREKAVLLDRLAGLDRGMRLDPASAAVATSGASVARSSRASKRVGANGSNGTSSRRRPSLPPEQLEHPCNHRPRLLRLLRPRGLRRRQKWRQSQWVRLTC